MRNALLVSALVGGTVSLLALLSTHAHPGAPPKPDDQGGPAVTGPLPASEVLRPDEALPAPSWVSERPAQP